MSSQPTAAELRERRTGLLRAIDEANAAIATARAEREKAFTAFADQESEQNSKALWLAEQRIAVRERKQADLGEELAQLDLQILGAERAELAAEARRLEEQLSVEALHALAAPRARREAAVRRELAECMADGRALVDDLQAMKARLVEIRAILGQSREGVVSLLERTVANVEAALSPDLVRAAIELELRDMPFGSTARAQLIALVPEWRDYTAIEQNLIPAAEAFRAIVAPAAAAE